MTKTLETALEQGTMITLSTTQRNPEIEERFKIFPGAVYGITIAGINPEIGISYVGRLEEVRLHVCPKGFVLSSVELRDGIEGERTPFEREILCLDRERVTAFGRIMDEERFRKRRENLYKKE